MSKTAIDIPELIYWHEGMLLAPQHFQQSSLRGELLVQAMATFLSPYGWGLARFDYTKGRLIGGDLEVQQLEAIMPDGLLVTAGSERAAPLELDLKPSANYIKDHPDGVLVYLTVSTRKSLSTLDKDLARYEQIDGKEVVDESSGNSLSIPSIRPKLELFLPTPEASVPPAARLQSIPLLRIKKAGEHYQAVEDFVAPVLSVSPGSPGSGLADACKSVAAEVRKWAQSLADQIDRPGYDSRDPDGLRPKLASLVSALPVLEATLLSEANPYSVYLAMCSLAGSVAALGHGLVPPQFKAYNHNDLGKTFFDVSEFIRLCLRQGFSETWTKIDFELLPDGVFQTGPLQKTPVSAAKLIPPDLALGLQVPSGVSEETIAQWGESCVFGKESVIPQLLANRFLGVKRTRVQELRICLLRAGSCYSSCRAIQNSNSWTHAKN